MCGRRFGKTALGIRWLCDGLLKGETCGWFAPNYKYANDAWDEMVGRLGAVIESKNEQDRHIELVNGGKLDIWTLDGNEPALGRKYHRIVVDEAGIVSDLLLLWRRNIRPTLIDYAGHGLFLGTPRGRRHGFMSLFQRGENDGKKWASFRASTLDNPYIDPEEIAEAREETPPELFKQEYEGIPTDDGANC